MVSLLDEQAPSSQIKLRCSVKVGDLVRGSKDNLEVQQKSIALIVGEDPYGRLSIIWVGGEIKGTRILHNFRPDEFEVP